MLLFVPAEVVAWWVGLAVVPVVAFWQRWGSARLLAGLVLAGAGVAYYRLLMAHRPAGYYALFESWAACGLVIGGLVLALFGVFHLWARPRAPTDKTTG